MSELTPEPDKLVVQTKKKIQCTKIKNKKTIPE
jgi:hypothetical protein